MASTTLEIVISARDQFTATANRVTGALDRMNTSAGRVGRGVGQVAGGFGRLAAVGGALAVGGLAAAAKSAIDFEDAFAGVIKTVDASAPELAALNQELRNLSTRIPVKFTDLAAIAAEAGALGVPTAEVAKFTDVVSRLSASTVGLTTEAAAEAFGKLGNVLNIHGADYERAASALIALGNAGASSEGDIVEVAKRFGAAGAQAGLSTAQVLGFSSAIASMGVEPEAAGTALSRLFQNITLDIAEGKAELKTFAEVSGTSVKGFSKAFKDDAAGAVQTFLQKLSEMDKFSAAKALKDAGITNIRSINAVLLLARGYAELNRQVDLSTEAYDQNTELADVSAKRFSTLKSKLTELKNSFVLAAVTIGEGMTPAIGRAADRLRDFLSLTTTQNSLKKFGEDIGKAIDSIDWKAVLDGARTFLDLLRTVVGILDKLPGQVKLAGAGLIAVLNTPLVGGAVGQIGKGIGNVGLGLLGGAGSLIGGKAGAAASLFAQPVRVVNWPAGFGTGGGGPTTVAGGPSKLASFLGYVGIASIAVAAGQAIADAIGATPDNPVSGSSRAFYRNQEKPKPAPVIPPRTTGGKSPDERDVENAINRVYDSLEKNRLTKQTAPDVNISGKTTVNVYVTSRDVVTKVTQTNRWGPSSGSAGGGRTSVLAGGV